MSYKLKTADPSFQTRGRRDLGFMGMETYKVNESKETDIKGLYIIGDARSGWSGVASCVAEGSEVAGAITHQIIEENWKNE